MPSLSVVVATFNEADNLRKCLQSIKGIASEIIVVDAHSTDGTVAIAQSFNAQVYLEPNRPMFHTNKQIALSHAHGDWILQLDADEVVDAKMKQAIRRILKINPPESGFFLKRKNYFLGRWLKKGGQYPDPVIRLVKAGKAFFPQKSVHEQMSVAGPIGTLDGHLLHYTAPSFIRYLTNSHRYTSLTASTLRSPNFFTYLVLKPMATFFKIYFRHLGLLDGFPGFIFALFSSLHWSTAYLKNWELKHVQS